MKDSKPKIKFLRGLCLFLLLAPLVQISSARQASSIPLEPQGWFLRAIPWSVDRRLGEISAASIDRRLFLKQAQVQSYIEVLGHRLEDAIPVSAPVDKIKFHFQVLRDPTINAFALPGGYVFINAGLVKAVKSSDELADIIGHEMGHVALRHSTQILAKMLGVHSLIGLVSLLYLGHNPGATQVMWGLAHDMAVTFVQTKFSRDNERAADSFAVYLSARAGFDPLALGRFLMRLPSLPMPMFLSTHPSNRDRLNRINVDARLVRFREPFALRHDSAAFNQELRRVQDLIGNLPTSKVRD